MSFPAVTYSSNVAAAAGFVSNAQTKGLSLAALNEIAQLQSAVANMLLEAPGDAVPLSAIEGYGDAGGFLRSDASGWVRVTDLTLASAASILGFTASGTNTAAVDLTVSAPVSTGNATIAGLQLKGARVGSTGTTAQTLVNAARIAADLVALGQNAAGANAAATGYVVTAPVSTGNATPGAVTVKVAVSHGSDSVAQTLGNALVLSATITHLATFGGAVVVPTAAAVGTVGVDWVSTADTSIMFAGAAGARSVGLTAVGSSNGAGVYAVITGTAAASDNFATSSEGYTSGTENIGTVSGGYASATHNSTGTVTTATGWTIRSTSKDGGAGAITTVVGLDVEAQTTGATNYAIRTAAGLVKLGGAFSCNGATPQTPAVFGAALAAYGTGVFGLDSNANMQALYNKVVAIDAALKANGIAVTA